MDTVRVDICYRPLRIAWAIHSSDHNSFRTAIRLSHTIWGGRFNPIVLVDREEAADLVDLYRADMIVPLGDAPQVKEFPKKFPHLEGPLFPDTLFFRDKDQPGRAQILDVHNALAHVADKPEWKSIKEGGLRTYQWDATDPLSDIFLILFGEYPNAEETGIDYLEILTGAVHPNPVELINIESEKPLSTDLLKYPSIAYLPRIGLSPHYSIRTGWRYPGLFYGDATNVDDLVYFWNIRAADIRLLFIDLKHGTRLEPARAAFVEDLQASLAHLDERRRSIGIYAQRDRLETALKQAGFPNAIGIGLDERSWSGGGISPPMMILGEESSLGVVSQSGQKPRVSFALQNKPFSADSWFYTQHLVASISAMRRVSDDHQYTFDPPFVPELNEFYGRAMIFRHDHFRVEPERVGLVIDACDHDSFLEPFRKVVESGESDVIHCRAPETKEGARCGSPNIAARRSAAVCAIPAI